MRHGQQPAKPAKRQIQINLESEENEIFFDEWASGDVQSSKDVRRDRLDFKLAYSKED